MKLVGCVLGYNEAEYLPYSIGSIYNSVDLIVFVEGAVKGRFDTPHSTDDTIEVVESLDVDNKIVIVQTDGFWSSYEEQKGQFSKYLEPGDWYVICDADEVYNEGDLVKLRRIIEACPQYNEYIPIAIEFYKDLRHILRPGDGVNPTQQRIVKHQPGAHWTCHHPVLCVNGHVDSVFNPIEARKRVVVPDMVLYHLSWTKSDEFTFNRHKAYNMLFEGMSEAEAAIKAKKKLEWAHSRVMYYDGHIPQILKGSKWDCNVVEQLDGDTPTKYKHWHTSFELYKPNLIPKVYNDSWHGSPKVSVIIPCYNNLDVLKMTLPRWLDMRYDNYEVIVVDDGSPADSGIKEYIESLGFKYLYNDSGDVYSISSARNLGIWHASGEIIVFADSDIIPDMYFIAEHVYNIKPNIITAGIRHHIDRCMVVSEADSASDVDSRWSNLLIPGMPIYDIYNSMSDDERATAQKNTTEFLKMLGAVIHKWGHSEYAPRVAVFSDRLVFPLAGGAFVHIPVFVEKPRISLLNSVISGSRQGECTDVQGHNFAVYRHQLMNINGFDEDFDGRWGMEETDLVLRLIKSGCTVRPILTAVGYHIDHIKRENVQDNNTRIFAMKNYSDSASIVRNTPKSWV